MTNFDFRIYTKRNDIKNNMCFVKDFYGDEIICEHDYRFKFSEVELMQFTGLKDCKGRKIYEGDIVKFKGLFDIGKYENVEIVFDKGEFCIKWRGSICHNLLASNSDSIEVIGNIHQNKDLLK